MSFTTIKITGKKVKRGRNIYHANTNQKEATVAASLSLVDKADFRRRKMIRGKKGHYIMIPGVISPRR